MKCGLLLGILLILSIVPINKTKYELNGVDNVNADGLINELIFKEKCVLHKLYKLVLSDVLSDVLEIGLEFTYEDLKMINNEQFIFNTFNIILNDSFKSVNDSNVLTTRENYFGNDFVNKPKNITFEYYNCELNNVFFKQIYNKELQ